jgi:RNA polymerase sigma-70 factor (ECF subfamily)
MSSKVALDFPDVLATTVDVDQLNAYTPKIGSDFRVVGRFAEIAPDHVRLPLEEIGESSDEELLEQVRRGTKEALALLFRRYAQKIRGVAQRILRNEAEADDLVQDVFIFIFKKAGLFDATRGTGSSWIIHVTYHRAFDRRRYLTSRRFYTNQELEDIAPRLVDFREEVPFYARSMDGILGKELTARFNARLTAEQRKTIQLYFFEGYSLKEIAQLTGQSLVNVRNQYYRGLDRLRKYVFLKKRRSE